MQSSKTGVRVKMAVEKVEYNGVGARKEGMILGMKTGCIQRRVSFALRYYTEAA
jgi:hypothetical protein